MNESTWYDKGILGAKIGVQQLLNLVTSKPDEELLKVLFQFFDPLHHCFTFLDYQLVPTMEEFSRLLGVPILDQLPFNGTEEHLKPEEIARALSL